MNPNLPVTTVPFSAKQRKAICWWNMPHTKHCDAIICDGAVRSGKTTALSLGFVFWAAASFHAQDFAFCGKTKSALRRNLLLPLTALLKNAGFYVNDRVSSGYVEIGIGGRCNRFWYFGGKDEGSAALIQGMTLAGVLFDEVVLMPRSFVEQALARCSVPGSRLWFSCNPAQPSHWFYQEWICKAAEKHAYYLHFTMEDNASLTPAVRRRYQRLYSGVFYDRYVRGLWTAAEGLVYPMFSVREHVAEPPEHFARYVISCDYGTMNPTSLGLWGFAAKRWYRIAESYYDARKNGLPRTDEEHYAALERLAGERQIEQVIVDPSAASFIACIRKHGKYRVVPARNDVLSGIRRTADALRSREILFSPACTDTIREFSLYVWDSQAARDCPLKTNDHAMDDIRYFVATVLDRPEQDAFYVAAVKH